MRRKQIRINTELRNDGNRPDVSFRSPHVGRVTVAADGVIGAAQDVGLDEVEREGVTAVEVLPREENGFGAVTARMTKDVPGGKVVWLFVDMDDVGLKLGDELADERIEVQVKTAIEPQRFDDEPIVVRMRAFQFEDAALVAPFGRHGDGQLNIRVGGDLFKFALVRADDAGFGDEEDAHGGELYRGNWGLEGWRLEIRDWRFTLPQRGATRDEVEGLEIGVICAIRLICGSEQGQRGGSELESDPTTEIVES